jgi:hypothetical protein
VFPLDSGQSRYVAQVARSRGGKHPKSPSIIECSDRHVGTILAAGFVPKRIWAGSWEPSALGQKLAPYKHGQPVTRSDSNPLPSWKDLQQVPTASPPSKRYNGSFPPVRPWRESNPQPLAIPAGAPKRARSWSIGAKATGKIHTTGHGRNDGSSLAR